MRHLHFEHPDHYATCGLSNDPFSVHREILMNEWGFVRTYKINNRHGLRSISEQIYTCATINLQARLNDLYGNYTCLIPADNETRGELFGRTLVKFVKMGLELTQRGGHKQMSEAVEDYMRDMSKFIRKSEQHKDSLTVSQIAGICAGLFAFFVLITVTFLARRIRKNKQLEVEALRNADPVVMRYLQHSDTVRLYAEEDMVEVPLDS